MSNLSISQIDKLGIRLRGQFPASEDDLRLLQELRAQYDDALATATALLRERLELEPTSRLKTVQTIIEKLAREKGRLSRMQDIAGLRVVREMRRYEQDALISRIVDLFPGARVVDRRAQPSHGYRAVHVIATVADRPVEIQVRTELQNLWAQLVERLGDRWGRQIRYGDEPDEPDTQVVARMNRREVLAMLMQVSDLVDELEGFLSEIEELEHELAASPSVHPAVRDALDRIEQTKGRERDVRQLLQALQGLVE